MSGFALLFDSKAPIATQDQDFLAFKESVADYKILHSTSWDVTGRQCAASKFDTHSTLHRGVTVNEETGSWLLAVGTVLDSESDLTDDLQPLLTAYLSSGDAVFEALDGPFALVIYDKPADRLVIVADPFGLVSVFYARRGSRFYVATSALAVAKAVQATPSEFGTYSFLTAGNVLGKHTLWQEVERLTPGTILEISQAGTRYSTYWKPTVKDEITQLSLTESVEYGLDLLSRLLNKYLRREGKTWADLTGGFDSRLITMMLRHLGLPFKASCEGPTASLDVRISSQIAQALGWDYQHNILPEDWGRMRYEWLLRALGKGDGHLDLFKMAGVLLDQERRAKEFNTSIWGLGGELLRGTIWKQEYLNVGRTSTVNYDRLVDYRLLRRPVEPSIFSDGSRVKWIRDELKSLLISVGDRYADSLNTLKLDIILAFKTTGHTGAHISAVMGQQRAIAPFYFKDDVTYAISTNYRWRNHSRLVRLLMEKVNPVMAGFETTDGGPALPMRVTNFYKFMPYLSLLGKTFAWKMSYSLLGRNLLSTGSTKAVATYPQVYPNARWRQDTLDCLEQDRVLDYAHMHSARLYDREGLADLLKRAHTEAFSQEVFLSRMLTVEMALRSVGASF